MRRLLALRCRQARLALRLILRAQLRPRSGSRRRRHPRQPGRPPRMVITTLATVQARFACSIRTRIPTNPSGTATAPAHVTLPRPAGPLAIQLVTAGLGPSINPTAIMRLRNRRKPAGLSPPDRTGTDRGRTGVAVMRPVAAKERLRARCGSRRSFVTWLIGSWQPAERPRAGTRAASMARVDLLRR